MENSTWTEYKTISNDTFGNAWNMSVSYGRRINPYVEYHISMKLIQYGFPILILIGLAGNSVSFILLVSRRLRNTSAYVYLAGLAVADNGVLLLSAFKTWIRAVFKWELLHVSNAGCKIIMCLFLVSLHLSAWLIVAMSTDRFLVVWFPFKATRYCTGTRARIIVVSLLVVMAIANSHVFWTLGLQSYDNDTVTICGPAPGDDLMTDLYPYLKLVSYSILPFIIVLILNLCIIWKLWTKHQSIGCENQSGSLNKKQNRVTVMLLTVSCLWLVLTAPFTLVSLLLSHTKDAHHAAQTLLYKTLCFTFLYINHSANFFLYCCVGGRFRRNLRDMICAKCLKMQRRSSMTKTGQSPFYGNNVNNIRMSMMQRDTKRVAA